jgi:hypothetical protein
LHADGLVGRQSPGGFCIRQETVSINAWPRIFLRIEKTNHGAVLRFEVRPFFAMALIFFPIVWLTAGVFGLGGILPYLAMGVLILLVVIYKWIMPWDLRRIDRLPSIRRALAPFGLRICEHCGYDLFGHENPQRCPECGQTCGD